MEQFIGKVDFVNRKKRFDWIRNFNWSKFFEINQTPYSILKVVPSRSVTNNDVTYLIDALPQICNKRNKSIKVLNGNIIDLFMPNNNATLEVNWSISKRPVWWEVFCYDGKFEFYLHVPSDREPTVKDLIKRYWKGSSVTTIDKDYLPKWDDLTTEAVKFETKYDGVLSLATEKKVNPVYGILQSMRGLEKDDTALFRVGLRYNEGWNKHAKEVVEEFKQNGIKKSIRLKDITVGSIVKRIVWCGGVILEEVLNFLDEVFNPDHKDMRDIWNVYKKKKTQFTSATSQKHTKTAFDTEIQVVIKSSDKDRRDTFIRNIETGMNEMNSEDNEWVTRKIPIKCIGRKIKGKTVTSTLEASKFIGVPDSTMLREFNNNVEPVVSEKVSMPEELLCLDGIPIAVYTSDEGTKKVVHFPIKNVNDFIRSKYFLGATRSGKSTAGVNFVIECFKKGYGSCFIDIAHGKTLREIASVLNEEERKKVAVLNFKQVITSIALAFNELLMNQHKAMENVDTIVQEVIYFFETIGGHPIGKRARPWLTNAIKAVMTHPDSSILDVVRMLTDKKYRDGVVATLTNPFLKRQWDTVWNKKSESMQELIIGECFSRMDLLLFNDMIRNTVMQRPKKDEHGEYVVNFKKWMDEGWIVLVQLSDKDILASTAIASLLISKIFLCALERGESDRPFHLVIDEPHKIVRSAERMNRILVECAKYRLGILALIHEWSQLKEVDRNLPATFINNAGHFIYFNTGTDNLEKVSHKLEPYGYDYEEVPSELKEHEGIMVITHNGKESAPFIAKGLAPVDERYGTYDFEDVFARSLDLYGRPFDEVTAEIFAETENMEVDDIEPQEIVKEEELSENSKNNTSSEESDTVTKKGRFTQEFVDHMEKELSWRRRE